MTKKESKMENQEVFRFMTKDEQKRVYDHAIKSGEVEMSFTDFEKSFGRDIFDAKTGKVIEIGGLGKIDKPLRGEKSETNES